MAQVLIIPNNQHATARNTNYYNVNYLSLAWLPLRSPTSTTRWKYMILFDLVLTSRFFNFNPLI